MKRTFTLLLGLIMLCSIGAQAQTRYYTFIDSSVTTYNDLTGATVLTTTFDQESYIMNLGFDLDMFGLTFAEQDISITRFGAVIGKNTAADRMFGVDAFTVWQFLPIDATSALSYLVEGTAGSRLIKIEYKNVTPKYGDPTKDVVNFQVWLHEDGSAIEIHIGPTNVTTSNGLYFDPNATGPQTGIFLSAADFGQKFEQQFLKFDPDQPTIEYYNNFVFLDAPPMYGKVYKFRHIILPPPPKSLMLASPVGGEVWKVGETHDITWGAESIDKVKIEYSTSNGSNWAPIATVDASLETYSWTVPNTISASCIVRISDNDDPSISSESLYPFEIQKASGSSITELPNELNIAVYPNPATDKLTISIPNNNSSINIRVLSITGKEIIHQNNAALISESHELQLPQLSSGTYLLEVTSGDKISRQYIIIN